MEVAASGIAVASIAIQLLNSTNTIRTFIRDVKNASQELLRVASLLDRLGGILQIVVDLLNQQDLLKDQPIPVPESVYRCLQRCEESIVPLQDIVNRYLSSQASNRLRRLQADVKASLKAGDVRNLEIRLQQEMEILSLALVTNGTRIQLHMYNVLLLKQTVSTKNPSVEVQAQQMTFNRGSSLVPEDRHVIARSTSTSFNTFSIHNIRTQRILHGQLSSDGRSGSSDDCTLMEEHEYYLALPFVRYGIFVSHQSRFGPIFPALRVYHIVDDIDQEFDRLQARIGFDSAGTLQTAIESGLLHPFTRDRRHRSLLHLAAQYRRPDQYRMLLGYGVKPDHGEQYHGVWESIVQSDSTDRSEEYKTRSVDTFRLLWDDYEEHSHLLNKLSTGSAFLTEQRRWSSEAVWLFHQSEAHLAGQELANLQDAVLRGVFINCIWDMNHKGLEWIQGILHTPAGTRLFESLNNGDFGLLDTFFAHWRLAQPRKVGTDIISVLVLFGIDIEACMIREFLEVPSGVVTSRWGLLNKRVTFSKEGVHGFNVVWEWVYQQSAPGYLVVSELTAFTVDSAYLLSPIDERFPRRELHGIGPLYMNRHDTVKFNLLCGYGDFGVEKWPPRFERRAAKKERKERARLGQKQARSKMPGSWVP